MKRKDEIKEFKSWQQLDEYLKRLREERVSNKVVTTVDEKSKIE